MIVVECDHCGHQDADEARFIHLVRFKNDEPVITHFCKQQCLTTWLEANPKAR